MGSGAASKSSRAHSNFIRSERPKDTKPHASFFPFATQPLLPVGPPESLPKPLLLRQILLITAMVLWHLF